MTDYTEVVGKVAKNVVSGVTEKASTSRYIPLDDDDDVD